MAATFYVTPIERKLLGTLPAELTTSWEGHIEEETQTSYETQEQLTERAASVTFDAYPAAKAVADRCAKALEAGEGIDALSLKGFPEEAMPSLLYMIGACGIEALIELSLADASRLTPKAMEAIAAMSRARHHILADNASA